ncbi:MAG: hypothetical protein ACM32K_01900, partial [Syntrophaceae bacterium]
HKSMNGDWRSDGMGLLIADGVMDMFSIARIREISIPGANGERTLVASIFQGFWEGSCKMYKAPLFRLQDR